MSSKPKFTKQHYEMIADALHKAIPTDTEDPSYSAFAMIADTLLDLFREDNPNFRSSTFIDGIIYGKESK